MEPRTPASVIAEPVSAVEILRIAGIRKPPKPHLSGCTPGYFPENLLDDAGACFGPCHLKWRSAVQNRHALPQPFVCLFSTAEHVLCKGLCARQPNEPVGLLYGQCLLLRLAVPARARGNDEAVNLSIRETVILERRKRGERDTAQNDPGKVGL